MSQITDAVQQKAQSLTNGYPVEGDIALAASAYVGSRLPGGKSAQVKVIRQPFFHRVNHAAATTITFFNENISLGITNMNNGQVPAQQVFALEAISLDLVTGVNRTGTAVIPNFSATVLTPVAALEQKRRIMELSTFVLKMGSETLLEVSDLTQFPCAGGLDVFSTVAAAGGACGYSTNGAPFNNNSRRFADVPHLLPGGSVLTAQIFIPDTTTATLPNSDNGFWKLMLHGNIFRK